MNDRELMQQVLEVLENSLQVMKDDWGQIDQEWGPSQGGLQAAIDGTLTGCEYFKETISAIAALRERLAQPDQPAIEELEHENRLMRARNERLQAEVDKLERENHAWRTKLGVRGYELQIEDLKAKLQGCLQFRSES